VLVRIDRLIYRARFAAAHESAVGTFEICPPILRMSADRGRPEVAVVTTLNRWTIKAAFARRLQSFAGGVGFAVGIVVADPGVRPTLGFALGRGAGKWN
jgi:hypothetical protein